MTVVDFGIHHDRPVQVNVSILVLVDDGRRLGAVNLRLVDGQRFQSLFLWMTVVDFPGILGTGPLNQVSILVLVDDGRRRRSAH